MPGDKKEMFKLLTQFSTIGFTMAGCVFIGLGFGYYLDTRVFDGKTSPWFTFIFLAFGIIAGFKNLYQMSKRQDL
ncbi:MAG: AtpZ/AtpI family protein [Deltaproteobacteria bacterium]|nr:AtpZ/AtpI family protein [Deltaproteobacteria bacterium]